MDELLRILIVEDDEVDRMMARRALKASGINADFAEAASSAEGLAKLEAGRFDVALIDYHLPDQDGLSLLRAARQAGVATPVIMLTGQGDEQLAVEMMKAGANDYLSKSRLSRDLLSHAVRHVVRLQRAQSQAQIATALSVESENRFRNMADSAPVLLWVTDEQMQVVYVNQRWLDFTGQSASEAAGHGWQIALHEQDVPRVKEVLDEAMASRSRLEMEYRIRRADGAWRWLLSRGIARILADGTFAGYVGSCIDITERKQAEQERADLLAREQAARAAAQSSEQRYKLLSEELRRAKEVAEAANASKDRFLAVLSHELRTPLTPVLSLVHSLQSEPELSPETRESLEIIRRNVELEARLIDDLLDLTRIAKGKLQLELRPQRLEDVLRNALSICQPELAEKRFDLALDLEAPDAWVYTDAARLQQIFWNLIKNAIKFTPAGGSIHVSARVNASSALPRQLLPVQEDLRATGQSVTVRVEDSGIGIDAQTLPRIFAAFEQGERSITRQFGGLGLGLAICRALIKMLGGTLRAESEGRGKGSAFIVELNTIQPPTPPERTKPAASRPYRDGSALRILLVDDHQDTAQAMNTLLTRLGHSITLADSVASANEAFDKNSFDLLISDIGLPDGSGLDIMRRARQIGATPGIALSGFGMEEDIQKSKNAGFSEHLTKPINFQRLESVIRELTACGTVQAE